MLHPGRTLLFRIFPRCLGMTPAHHPGCSPDAPLLTPPYLPLGLIWPLAVAGPAPAWTPLAHFLRLLAMGVGTPSHPGRAAPVYPLTVCETPRMCPCLRATALTPLFT